MQRDQEMTTWGADTTSGSRKPREKSSFLGQSENPQPRVCPTAGAGMRPTLRTATRLSPATTCPAVATTCRGLSLGLQNQMASSRFGVEAQGAAGAAAGRDGERVGARTAASGRTDGRPALSCLLGQFLADGFRKPVLPTQGPAARCGEGLSKHAAGQGGGSAPW